MIKFFYEKYVISFFTLIRVNNYYYYYFHKIINALTLRIINALVSIDDLWNWIFCHPYFIYLLINSAFELHICSTIFLKIIIYTYYYLIYYTCFIIIVGDVVARSLTSPARNNYFYEVIKWLTNIKINLQTNLLGKKKKKITGLISRTL